MNFSQNLLDRIKRGESRLREQGELVCKCDKEARIRLPYLADEEDAIKQAYLSCDDCFNRTWSD
jgi:hypothetical protein